jgi:hypothetical protein
VEKVVKGILVGVVLATALGARSTEAMHAMPPATPSQLVARAVANDSTRRLLALSATYGAAAPVERAAARRVLRAAAIERRRTMLALMESDPAGMLALAIPDAVRASLPAVVRSKVERDAEVEGELEILHVDDDGDGRYLYTIRAHGRRIAAFTAGELPPDALTGARVRVRGKSIGRALAFDASSSAFQLVTTATPNTFGVQATAVLLVTFQDDGTQPFTPSAVTSMFFTNASNYDRETSYQQTWLSGAVFGWYTIPLSKTVCDTATLATQARNAATSAGADLSAFRRFVYVFPRNACTWAGLGTVGGNPSHAWLNGLLTMALVTHEMGHNLGLYHSHALDCSNPTACTSIEYGDVLDVMGQSVSGHYNAFQKERLGWLGTAGMPPVTTVQTSGSYAIAPFESVGTSPKALKVLKSTDPTTGARTWYYVELRRAMGFDSAYSASPNLMGGVVVHTGAESGGDTSFLLDMTPETATRNDPALVVGRTFSDPGAGITIRPTSAGDAGAVVAVTVGASTCTHGALSIDLPADASLAAAGMQSTSVVTITNGDSPACQPSTVQLSASAPAGWAASLTRTALALAPGDVATVGLTLGVPSSTPPGRYGFAVSMVPSGGTPIVAQGSLDVATGLGVQVRTDAPTYPASAYVFVTVVVASGSQPAANASVDVTMVRPNGATQSRTLVTDGQGAAATSFRLRRASPGTYVVRATGTVGGISGQGQTTFGVQ